jgi:competence protein ComEC
MHGAWHGWLDAERERLALWLPVALAAGIALWFALPFAAWRAAAALGLLAVLAGGGVAGLRPLALAAGFALTGMAAIEARVAGNSHVVLADRLVATFDAQVAAAEPLTGGGQRLVLVADVGRTLPGGIARARLTLRGDHVPVPAGARVRLRALLSPPAGAAVPGGLDLARRAWFDAIGATGVVLGPVTLLALPPPSPHLWLDGVRAQLQALIVARVPGEAGAMAAAFVTGQQRAIPQPATQAMRDAGLAHLLSISGLHIAVVVGGVALAARMVLALWPWLALRVPVPTIALGLGALAGMAYTVLAGAQVPTVRAAIAATIVVLGMMLGRQALSLRLLGAAALAILAMRPEVLLGASFQLSFAAVIGIVALYESRLGRWLATTREDEGWWHRLARGAAALLASGLVAELALSGIGLFHFGRGGLYGIGANLIAIPFTSFVVLPTLMLALLAEALGQSWLWPLAGWAMQQLIDLADATAALPGAVITAVVPAPAFALGIAGGMWLALWQSRVRWWGIAPVLAAVLIARTAPLPDLLVSGDGRHLALRLPDGQLAHSRERVGHYLIGVWTESIGGDPDAALWLGASGGARCSPDACLADVVRGGRRWRVLATTSAALIPRETMAAACGAADIVVSDRRLPDWCRPRWLMLDRAALAMTGAVAIRLAEADVITVRDAVGDRPWQPEVDAIRRRPPRAAAASLRR